MHVSPKPRSWRRSELRAAAGKGLARMEAEAEWRKLHSELDAPVHIFRLGGACSVLLGQMQSSRNTHVSQPCAGSELADELACARRCRTGIYGPGRSALDAVTMQVLLQPACKARTWHVEATKARCLVL